MKPTHLYFFVSVTASSIASACGGGESSDEASTGGFAGAGGSAGSAGGTDDGGAGATDDGAGGSGGADGGAVGAAGSAGAAGSGGASGGAAGSAGAAGSDLPTTETLAIVSDGSWRTYGADIGEDPPSGWNTVSFDDRSWAASIAPNPAACGTYEPSQSWERPNEPMWDVSNKYSAFFRKVVTVAENATVNAAKITTFADDDIAIWVNGSVAFIEPNFGVVEGGTIVPNEVDLKPFLVPGPNLIAIHAQDTIGVCRWAAVSGSLEFTR